MGCLGIICIIYILILRFLFTTCSPLVHYFHLAYFKAADHIFAVFMTVPCHYLKPTAIIIIIHFLTVVPLSFFVIITIRKIA